jgi:hypothetical protein
VHRHVLRVRDSVCDCQRLLRVSAAQRDTGLQDAHGPLIPAVRVRARTPIRVARSLQESRGLLVIPANEMNLRERVEHRTRRLAHELQRAAHIEGPVQYLLGASQIAETHADLSERRERNPEAVRSAGVLLQFHAALGQRERLIVAVLHHRHVRLIAAHDRKDVVRVDHDREPLGVAERRHRLVEPAVLRERHTRQ